MYLGLMNHFCPLLKDNFTRKMPPRSPPHALFEFPCLNLFSLEVVQIQNKAGQGGGRPAARMPQVAGQDIKRRAAALRAAGAQQVRQHLTAQRGTTHRILMENSRMGRTEQFTEVTLSADQPEGEIITAKITGMLGETLTA